MILVKILNIFKFSIRTIVFSMIVVLFALGYLFINKSEVFAVSMPITVELDRLQAVFLNIKEYTESITHNSQVMSIHILDLSHVDITDPTPSPSSSPTAKPVVSVTSAPTITVTTKPETNDHELFNNFSNLLSAINIFRLQNGKSSILPADTLCTIAQFRLNELKSLGNLDHHEGFSKFFDTQKEFNRMGETIYQSTESQSDEAVVSAWDKSEPHKKILLESSYTHGCGARSNTFAVFILGFQ